MICYNNFNNKKLKKEGEKMSYGISVEVWGEYALFTRPEHKAERVSYEALTPSAARGILEAIFWHPGMTWIIDCIYVLKPIQFAAVKKNEVRSKINARTVSAAIKKEQGSLYLAASEDRQQRAAVMLKDVHYVIKAHFELTDKANPSDNHGKFPISSSGDCGAGSAFINLILEPESFRLIFGYGMVQKFKRPILMRQGIWDICCMTWTIRIR
mgnify:CR=1 FL=1